MREKRFSLLNFNKMKIKIPKIGLLFTFLIIVLALIPISYSSWNDQISITGTITTWMGEGCTPGYWKNHLNWTNYSTDQTLDTIFDFPSELKILEGYTLFDALSFEGAIGIVAKSKLLLKQATAGLLNVADINISYFFSEEDIIDQVNSALASLDENRILELKEVFDFHNNLGVY